MGTRGREIVGMNVNELISKHACFDIFDLKLNMIIKRTIENKVTY